MTAHQFTLSPHPEEAASAAVSKDAPARTGTSFETRTASAPQDEGSQGLDDTKPAYNYAYLDEQTKRMIRRALLKAVAVPGYQVPFGSREMPLARGWGTGGIQITAAIIGPDDTLKVIDQGADDTTNAVSIRRFFERTADARTTEATGEATIIQTRHRIPEAPLQAGQIMVYQVPQPEPLRKLEPREAETRKMHAWAEYGLMQVKLYENIARFGEVTTTYDYPVMVNGRYVMAPSPIPKFDNPKMHMSPALQLFGAGREKRIYALPPHTSVRSLDFEDHPFRIQSWNEPCGLCGAKDSYLDEVITDDRGGRMFVCSDSHHCETRREQGHRGAMLADASALHLVGLPGSAVVPGDRRETRDPCLTPTEQGSGMDPGSTLRSARDGGAGSALQDSGAKP